MAFSSVFQRSSWKLDQLTPTTCAIAVEQAPATRAAANKTLNCFCMLSPPLTIGGCTAERRQRCGRGERAVSLGSPGGARKTGADCSTFCPRREAGHRHKKK